VGIAGKNQILLAKVGEVRNAIRRSIFAATIAFISFLAAICSKVHMIRTFIAFLTALTLMTSTASAAGPGDHFTFIPSLDPHRPLISYREGAGYILIIAPLGPTHEVTIHPGYCKQVGILVDEDHLAGGRVRLHFHGGRSGVACNVWIGRQYDRETSVDLFVTLS
jgi:hypothetical protein